MKAVLIDLVVTVVVILAPVVAALLVKLLVQFSAERGIVIDMAAQQRLQQAAITAARATEEWALAQAKRGRTVTSEEKLARATEIVQQTSPKRTKLQTITSVIEAALPIIRAIRK